MLVDPENFTQGWLSKFTRPNSPDRHPQTGIPNLQNPSCTTPDRANAARRLPNFFPWTSSHHRAVCATPTPGDLPKIRPTAEEPRDAPRVSTLSSRVLKAKLLLTAGSTRPGSVCIVPRRIEDFCASPAVPIRVPVGPGSVVLGSCCCMRRIGYGICPFCR